MSDRPGRRESAARSLRLTAKMERLGTEQRAAAVNALPIRPPERVEAVRRRIDNAQAEVDAQFREAAADIVDPDVSLGEAGSRAKHRLRRIARGG
mgnify:CR=1 FL=1